MGYLVVTFLLAIIVVVTFSIGRSFMNSPDPMQVRTGRVMKWSSIIIGVLLFCGWTAVQSFHSVSAGHVGLVYSFGNIVDQTGAGLVTTLPWQNLTEASVQTERAHFDGLEAFSSDTQDVQVSATVNWHVDDANIQRLYREVGPGFFDKLVPTRVNQLFKDETVKYTAVRIAPERETIRRNVLSALKKELEPYSITVEDFLIDNIKFSPAFTAAIEDKVVATQEAQAAFNRIKKSKNNATALIAEATGIKRSNQLKKQSLTKLLVQQAAIDKLNPNVKVIILPSGSNFLLPADLVGGSK